MPSGTAWRRLDILDRGRHPHGERAGFCYFDTETTGLAGGTGTLIFCATVARATEAGLEVAQVFLSEPGAEGAFLEALNAELDGTRGIGTYNGASFDLPILRTRWALSRLPGDPALPAHTDLLHLVRALYGARLPSRTLREVEFKLLGFEREDDLPGALAPEAYFAYLRRGSSPLLEPALAHNRQDAISLYHLHLLLLERLAQREAGLDGDDLYALGRVLTKRGRKADGWRALRRAAALADGKGSAAAAVLLARGLVKRRRVQGADRLLAEVQATVPEPVLAVVRARIREWRLRDLPGALEIVEQALSEPGAWAEDLDRRRRRLRRRLKSDRRRDHRVGVQQAAPRGELLQLGDQPVVEHPALPADPFESLRGAEREPAALA
ncbi:MAG TPA: ribonuclease H-like domain-containing protein [Candidatus Dormibacteraeota bacterium]